MRQVLIITFGVIILVILITILVLEIVRYVRTTSTSCSSAKTCQGSGRTTSPSMTGGATDTMRPPSLEPMTITYQDDTTENQSYTSVVDTENKRTIKSGNIISVACNGPTMFYLHQDMTIEAVNEKIQPRHYNTNLRNATQIHVFDQMMYAVDDGKLMVAGRPKNNLVNFVRVPAFSTINDVKRITSRANRFAIILKSGQIHVYQHKPKFTYLSSYDGVDFFFGYDEDVFAVLLEGNILRIYGKSINGPGVDYEEQEGVLTMAFQRNNTPVIISSDRDDVVAIESYFGNIYILIRR